MKLQNSLNTLLADLNQMLMLSYQVHWYMRGKGFLYLHPMLDGFISEYQGDIDEVAEQLIILGGAPYSTLQELASNTRIELNQGSFELTIDQQLENLVKGLKQLNAILDETISIADEENAQGVVDTLGEMKVSTEKHIWMLNAELGRPARA